MNNNMEYVSRIVTLKTTAGSHSYHISYTKYYNKCEQQNICSSIKEIIKNRYNITQYSRSL